MTASRHRRLARTGGHPPRRAPVSKCAPCCRPPAPRVNARFCRSETDTERRTRCSASPSNYRPSARNAGVELHLLQRVAGHQDPAVTSRYLHPDTQAMLDAGLAVSAWWSGTGPERPTLRVVRGGRAGA
jgi:hypothetical protein